MERSGGAAPVLADCATPGAQSEGDKVLEVRALGKRYGDVVALRDVSFTVAPKTFVAIVGPSGCGKSTLLEIVAGLRTHDDGVLTVNGEPVQGPSSTMGNVFQEDSTLPWRTVVSNVEFPLQMAGMSKAERRQRSTDVLKLVDLWDFRDAYPHQLSGGMRQRVAIARMLATRPQLLLMDEPFGALDEQTRLVLGLELLRIVAESEASVLFVTHSIQEAVLLADKVIVMTGRPGTVALDVDVPLPSPRSVDIVGSAEGGRLIQEIWHSLQAEATRAAHER